MSILGDDKEEGETPPNDLEQCVKELMDAVKADDIKAAVSAFRAAFMCMESEPHEES